VKGRADKETNGSPERQGRGMEWGLHALKNFQSSGSERKGRKDIGKKKEIA